VLGSSCRAVPRLCQGPPAARWKSWRDSSKWGGSALALSEPMLALVRSLLTVLFAGLLAACGGETQMATSSAGGNGGTAGATATSSAGGNGGTSGATECCGAFPTCPTGERTAQAGECPGLSSCHELSACCSIWCVAAKPCFDTWCTATQACVAYRAEGGVRLSPDGGTCPSGEHLEGTTCHQDFAYKCSELHGACQHEPVTCACAQSYNPGTCPARYGYCSEPGSTVDPSAQLVCEELLP
jgi:hypothetical protein